MCGSDGVAIFDALHRHGTVSEAMLYAFDLLPKEAAGAAGGQAPPETACVCAFGSALKAEPVAEELDPGSDKGVFEGMQRLLPRVAIAILKIEDR